MGYVVIAFRSREHSVKFSAILTERGIPNNLVNTPKEAGVGCGLSVKVSENNYYFAVRLLRKVNFSSFAGRLRLKNTAAKSRFGSYKFLPWQKTLVKGGGLVLKYYSV